MKSHLANRKYRNGIGTARAVLQDVGTHKPLARINIDLLSSVAIHPFWLTLDGAMELRDLLSEAIYASLMDAADVMCGKPLPIQRASHRVTEVSNEIG